MHASAGEVRSERCAWCVLDVYRTAACRRVCPGCRGASRGGGALEQLVPCRDNQRPSRPNTVTDNEWVFFLGGPKDGQVLLGDQDADGLLMFDLVGEVAGSMPRFAYYRLTGAATATDKGPISACQLHR